jgi:hypothetical protein
MSSWVVCLTSCPSAYAPLQAAGRAKPSYIATYRSAEDLSPEEERLIKWEAVNLYVGGSDTVRVSPHGLKWMPETTFRFEDSLRNEDFCSLHAPQSICPATRSSGD